MAVLVITFNLLSGHVIAMGMDAAPETDVAPSPRSSAGRDATYGATGSPSHLWHAVLEIVLIVTCVTLAIVSPEFLTKDNLLNVLKSVSEIGIIAFGMTMVIIAGEIDLSVGSAVAFAGCLTAYLVGSGVGVPLAIVVALSRVFVGVHYPSDIVVGAALGTLAGLAVAAVSNKIAPMVIKNIPKEVTETMPVKIEVRQGDITEADTEAIVNAANNQLWMGSGVAGAIKRKGGDEIEKDAMAKGPIEIGEAVESTAGKLPFKYVIHAAGMGQDLKTDEDLVYRVTKNSILLADRLNLKSLAFPAIGTGIGGFPLNVCARVMIRAARELSNELKSIERIQFVLFDDEGYKAFSAKYEKIPGD